MDWLGITASVIAIGWIPAYFVYWVIQRRREGRTERIARERREIGLSQ